MRVVVDHSFNHPDILKCLESLQWDFFSMFLQCIKCLRTWRRSMISWTMPWVWEFTDYGRTFYCMRCTLSLGHNSWMWRGVQVRPLCVHNCNTTGNPQPNPDPNPAGDIAFRFLEYVRSQQELKKRRAVRSMQTPSGEDISDNYSTEDRPRESRAVVCDINKEMLRVGKQKADSMGIAAGMFSSDSLVTTKHICLA